jgi:hypothetical protein
MAKLLYSTLILPSFSIKIDYAAILTVAVDPVIKNYEMKTLKQFDFKPAATIVITLLHYSFEGLQLL